MSAEYYEDPLLLYQGLMPDPNAISASAAVGIFYTSPALQTGGNALRPPSVILTEVLIANTSATATASVGLFLPASGASATAGCAVFPDVMIEPSTFTRMTFATVLPAGASIRGRCDINAKVCLHISGVKRTPRQP